MEPSTGNGVHFAYNGNRDRANKPIIESDFETERTSFSLRNIKVEE